MNNSRILAVITVVIIVIAVAGVLSFTGGNNNGETVTITQKGSDTLLELMQNCAERFHESHPDIVVEVTGGGSGTGIAALIAGEVDVAQASRQMKPSEREQLPEAVEFRVAIDGIAIIVNANNPITQLTMEQLRGIYNGTYTNWNQLGGLDMSIVTYGRQSTSGTFAFFQEAVLHDEDYRADMQQMAGNSAIVDAVNLDEGGIGYVGIGYAQSGAGIKILNLSAGEGPAYSPLDADAVYAGDYPLARYLYLYTDGTPTGAISTWIGWILSEDGQAVVEEIGFYPLSESVIAEEVAKLGS